MDDRPYRVGERWVNPLPDEASRAKWEPEKKDPLRGSFFSYRPSAGAAPRSVPTQQTVYVVAPALQLLTISLAKPFLSNTTWQARHGQLAEQFYLFIQTPLDRRGMASLQSNSTFSFKHHLTWPACRAILPFHSNTTWQTRHGQLEEQFYLFIQTPLDRRGMASLQSNSTFSFNTTWQGSHAWHGICILYVRPL